MKMHYKKIGVVLATISLFSATAVLAENSVGANSTNRAQMVQDGKVARQEVRTQNVCEKIAQFSDNLNQKSAEEENSVKTRQEERLTNWGNKTSEADYKLESLRNNWDNNRDEQFKKLEEKADTTDQKKAVSAFEAATKSAIATRRAAVDAAIATFRTGVENSIKTRQGQVDGIISASMTSRADALAKAKTDCAAGKDAAAVRADFQNGLKGARTKMQNDRQDVTKVGATVQTLAQIRRTTVEKAMSDFKATMEKARVALKVAFPDQTATTSDTTFAN